MQQAAQILNNYTFVSDINDESTLDPQVSRFEAALRDHPLVSQCLVLGETEEYLAALVVPDKVRLIQYLREQDPEQVYRLDGYHRLNDIDVRAVYCDLLEDINKEANDKRIERFALLDSMPGASRAEMCEINRPIIDSLYQDYVPGIG